MLKPVVRPREHRPALVPDDLLGVQEADAQQAVENLAREHRGVPDVSDLQARHQFEGLRPVGARVAGDRRFGVALGAVLHVAGFGGPAAVQAGAVAPFGIELDAVRRIGDHQQRLALAQQPRHGFRRWWHRRTAPGADCGVAAEPQVAGAGHGILGQRRRRVGLVVVIRASQQIVDLLRDRSRSGSRSKSASLSSCNSRASSSSSQSAQVTERFTISRNALTCASRPLVAEDHRDCGRVAAGPRSQLARGLQPQVAVDHLAVAAGQHRNLEAEFADAAAHAIHGGVVLARVAGVEDEAVDRPDLNLKRLWGI